MWYTKYDKLETILNDISNPDTPPSILRDAVAEARSRGVICDESGYIDVATVPASVSFTREIF